MLSAKSADTIQVNQSLPTERLRGLRAVSTRVCPEAEKDQRVMAMYPKFRKSPFRMVVLLGGFVAILTAAWTAAADLPAPTPAPPPLALDAAIRLALQQNPEIAAMRQQHGIAAAGVVVARAYPFKPVFESRVRS